MPDWKADYILAIFMGKTVYKTECPVCGFHLRAFNQAELQDLYMRHVCHGDLWSEINNHLGIEGKL